ncbi:pyridoxal phosphate phosphatase PHOSPHO2 [Fopius arisanus]|uniref:Pyridoxal phosphate phosphatase PHOSPHO2 n=1 Tax=Fopius arisanus TaxID=64838 RepID=A0A9R1U4R7_9HYME|nr:PREDICTED: pyridoxal phosphate phosphatase PHOSPHO2-like [Fopius arisanus]
MIAKQLRAVTSRVIMTKPLLIAFDFDHTIANKNSDHVAHQMLPGGVPADVKELYHSGGGWTEFMRRCFQLLHAAKISKDDLESTVNAIPPVPGYEDLLNNLHSNNCEVIIISDSNSVFIDNWLVHKKLRHTITNISTNPAFFDDEGMLHVKEYQDQDFCDLSERNLCKGYVLETYIKERADEGVEFQRIAYAGDGKNDFCPMLKLSKNDLAFPRKDYTIMEYLNNPGKPSLKAEILPWTDGYDIWREITSRINF